MGVNHYKISAEASARLAFSNRINENKSFDPSIGFVVMIIKIVIVLILFAILFSLGSALYHLTKGREHSARLAKALTIRISISIALFVLLLIAFATGLITPHGIREGLVQETRTDK